MQRPQDASELLASLGDPATISLVSQSTIPNTGTEDPSMPGSFGSHRSSPFSTMRAMASEESTDMNIPPNMDAMAYRGSTSSALSGSTTPVSARSAGWASSFSAPSTHPLDYPPRSQSQPVSPTTMDQIAQLRLSPGSNTTVGSVPGWEQPQPPFMRYHSQPLPTRTLSHRRGASSPSVEAAMYAAAAGQHSYTPPDTLSYGAIPPKPRRAYTPPAPRHRRHMSSTSSYRPTRVHYMDQIAPQLDLSQDNRLAALDRRNAALRHSMMTAHQQQQDLLYTAPPSQPPGNMAPDTGQDVGGWHIHGIDDDESHDIERELQASLSTQNLLDDAPMANSVVTSASAVPQRPSRGSLSMDFTGATFHDVLLQRSHSSPVAPESIDTPLSWHQQIDLLRQELLLHDRSVANPPKPSVSSCRDQQQQKQQKQQRRHHHQQQQQQQQQDEKLPLPRSSGHARAQSTGSVLSPAQKKKALQPRYGRVPVEHTVGNRRRKRRTRKLDIHGFGARATNACVDCRRSKVKCDNNRPCERCIKRGTPETCRDSVHRRRGRSKPLLDPSGSVDMTGNPPLSSSASTSVGQGGGASGSGSVPS